MDLVPIILPIMQEIRSLGPKTATIADVVAMCHKYKVTAVGTIKQDPVSIGNALLNLETQMLRSKLPANKTELPTNILNTAVQLAVTALKA